MSFDDSTATAIVDARKWCWLREQAPRAWSESGFRSPELAAGFDAMGPRLDWPSAVADVQRRRASALGPFRWRRRCAAGRLAWFDVDREGPTPIAAEPESPFFDEHGRPPWDLWIALSHSDGRRRLLFWTPVEAHAAVEATIHTAGDRVRWLNRLQDEEDDDLERRESGPSEEEHGFLQAIVGAPDDDAPRLIYADWLDEQADAERAEFIRLGVAHERWLEDKAAPTALPGLQLPKLRRPAALNPPLEEIGGRLAELLVAHQTLWAPRNRLNWRYGWRRGFIHSASVLVTPQGGMEAALRQWLDELQQLPLAEHVKVEFGADAPLRGLPAESAIRALAVGGAAVVDDESFAPLAGWRRLESLSMSGSAVGDRAIDALLAVPTLRELSLSESVVTTSGLARLKGLERLEALDLTHARRLGERLGDLLVSWPRLRRIAVSSDQFSPRELRRLTEGGTMQMMQFVAAAETTDERALDPLFDLKAIRALDLVGFGATRGYLRRLKQRLKLERLRKDGVEVF